LDTPQMARRALEEAEALTARSRQIIADGEQLTREEAEALTETIGRALADADQLCIELLEGGVRPSRVAAVVLESWGRFREGFTALGPDAAEVVDSMWEHIEAPRLTAILNWQPPANGGAS
jgi:hypothetical protein